MKKILTILTVALLACSTVFAAVNFSGELVAGYQFNYNKDEWTSHVQGQDGGDSNTTKLNLGVADDNGVWSIGIEGVLVADGRVSGDISLDMMKLFGATESDFSLKVALAANDEQTGLRAYSNQSGNNYDRIRTGAAGLWTSITLGYTDLVQVQVAGAPRMGGVKDGGDMPFGQKPTGWGANAGDVVVSALIKPVAGIAVSADWAYNGEDKSIVKVDDPTSTDPEDTISTPNKGVVGGAVDVNVGTLVGLDFDLGVSVADRYEYESTYNALAATVYGGVDAVNGYVEYALLSQDETMEHYLVAQVNLGVVEGLPIDVYFGAENLAEFADTFFVGGDIAYEVSGVNFALNVEYAKAGAFNADYTGLSITPSVGVSF